MKKVYNILAGIAITATLIVLPLVGVTLKGKPATRYLEFPPLTRYIEHADFSWPVFIALAVLIMAVVLPFALRVITSRGLTDNGVKKNTCSFPRWGWFGLGLLLISWFMAWTRFDWFEPLQIFTFSPIWFGYILVINGLTCKRTGHCMLKDRPLHLFALFFISAFFWWYFEYLNRFVQNWHYVRIDHLSRLQYFVFATLPFSTVLPAVLGTNELLESIPRISAGLDNFVSIPVHRPRTAGFLGLLFSAAGLAAIGIWPDYLFPLLWLSPLIVVTSVQTIRGETTVFSGISRGKWRRVYLLALSALVCGFFWELWNFRSVAKWIYAVPFVNRFRIFEMPVLGYAGYLPFGLECAVVADLLAGKHKPVKSS